MTADYLLGLSETKNHPNANPADLRLSDDMIELLKSGRVNNSLLCEFAAHPEQASLAFICKRLKLNLKKLSENEKKWLKKIAKKSDLLKSPNPQRGGRK